MGKHDTGLAILDCTIRDGNYAVNFKFTEADTRLITDQLVKLGFKWIEIGHGLGLGAMEAGKGNMPADDIELVRVAKSVCADARIGMFFIPEIGRKEHLKKARDAGLDFVRIGLNAPDVPAAYPYLTYARKLGFIPCLNMMKTYTITPKEFAIRAKEAADSGAEIIYCVDSSGSMLPDDIARYFDAARELTECEFGFHGHNNLMMAIANCIAAYKHGARYLDASLCGLGRSAGNAPTEVLIAVFERLGISTGIDLFKVMDVIDSYIWPLAAQMRPHDMMSVVAGFSHFHSSLLPKVASVARKYNVELRRLVAKVASLDPTKVEDAILEAAAQEISSTENLGSSDALTAFYSRKISDKKISNSIQSVQELVEGLLISSAKRQGIYPVLHLVPNNDPIDGLLLPEFTASDNQMVMGRVTFGSFDDLNRILEAAHRDIFMFLVSQHNGWAEGAFDIVAQRVGVGRTVSVRDYEIRKQFLLEMLDFFARRFGKDELLVYSPYPLILNALGHSSAFSKVYIYGAGGIAHRPFKNSIILDTWDDCRNLKLLFNVILCCENPAPSDIVSLRQALVPKGKIISLLPLLNNVLLEAAVERVIPLDLNLAYSGIVSRYLVAEKMIAKT